ncbi:MAG TPA: P1 family peptidase [Vicinamibacterales bacterium]|nr:P1 family peptidase [Vicinamibacterales bacterium]
MTRLLPLLLVVISVSALAPASPPPRPRARNLGLAPGVFPPGPLNAITDVHGVRVGQVTLIRGDDVRTGVTAILPHGGNIFQDKVAGAIFVGNAFGKLAGSTQVAELGTIETPIVLTNTLSVGTAVEAVVRYTLAEPGNEDVRSVNAVVGETNDGGLNDIRGLHVTVADVIRAIRTAREGPVAEGSVGAGTGTICFGWKGGIGTASRVLPAASGGYTLGVLVQTNFGGVLTMGGAPVGKELGRYAFKPQAPRTERREPQKASEWREPGFGAEPRDEAGRSPAARTARPRTERREPQKASEWREPGFGAEPRQNGDGSCMIVVATDAPIDARDLRRLAARAIFGLARTGSSYSNGSGDFAIAFSTSPQMRSRFGDLAPRTRTILPPDAMSPLFEAALEATEEAVYNSLLQATTVSSRFGTAQAIPIDRVEAILRKYGVGH